MTRGIYFEIHFPRDRAGVTHMRVANEALELCTALFASLTKLSLGGRTHNNTYSILLFYWEFL